MASSVLLCTALADAHIERNASALAHIIDDLLDVSRIVAGTLHLVPQPVDLVAEAQAALDGVRPLAAAKNVRLAFSPDLEALEPVSGDTGRLQKMNWNLLANAIKFTPENGRVGVVIERSNDYMEVRVVDSGQGISPAFVPKPVKPVELTAAIATITHNLRHGEP